MKKMKKWELLKKAYETFPAGTIARFKSAPKVEHVSDGTFRITKDRDNGICVVNESDTSCFYASRDSNTGAEIEDWAIPDETHEPKKEFVMMSEDWVSLEEGDVYFGVYKDHGKYILDQSDDEATKGKSIKHYLTVKSLLGDYKIFSTKEAAEKWILETNKPKEINIDLFGSNKASIFSEKIIISCGNAYSVIKPSDLEDMLHAYKSLQS